MVDMPGRMVGDPGEHVGNVELRIEALSLALSISEYIAAARRPPVSDPANSQFLRKRSVKALVKRRRDRRRGAASSREEDRRHAVPGDRRYERAGR
jgi:hypothetical protein